MNKVVIVALMVVVAAGVGGVGEQASANEGVNHKELRLQERQNRQEVRAQFKQEKVLYKEARQDVKQAKQVRDEYKNANKQKREQMRSAAPEKLIKAIDRMIARLSKIKNWANNRGAISDTQKASINAQIDRDIAWLTAKKSKVKGASPEEIKTHLAEVREYWKNNRAKVKVIMGQVLIARSEAVLVRADKISARIDAKIAQFEAAGKDVAAAKRLAADFDAKVALAKDNVTQAKRLFGGVSNVAQGNRAFAAGHAKLKEARKYLREARAIARNIVASLKQ